MKKDSIRILFLAANPEDSPKLQLDKEVNRIDEELLKAKERDKFELNQRHAVSLSDLQGLLLRFEPHIVHFSGHGSEESALVFENEDREVEVAPPAALTSLFRIVNSDKRTIQCVVMNACYSERQAEAISKYVPCVIGMSTAISDEAAIKFAASFYRGLGFGQSVNNAFELGCNDIALHNIPEEATPRLKYAPGVDPSKVFLTTWSDNNKTDIVSITNTLTRYFQSDLELKKLCAGLREFKGLKMLTINNHDIKGRDAQETLWNIVEYCERNKKLPQLLSAAIKVHDEEELRELKNELEPMNTRDQLER